MTLLCFAGVVGAVALFPGWKVTLFNRTFFPGAAVRTALGSAAAGVVGKARMLTVGSGFASGLRAGASPTSFTQAAALGTERDVLLTGKQ